MITYFKRTGVCMCVCVCVCARAFFFFFSFNLRYKTHQAQWLRLSSDDKAMCCAATTQTEPNSLGMLVTQHV